MRIFALIQIKSSLSADIAVIQDRPVLVAAVNKVGPVAIPLDWIEDDLAPLHVGCVGAFLKRHNTQRSRPPSAWEMQTYKFELDAHDAAEEDPFAVSGREEADDVRRAFKGHLWKDSGPDVIKARIFGFRLRENHANSKDKFFVRVL